MTDEDVRRMSQQEKIGEALLRSIPLLPAETQAQVRAMLTPESLKIIAGTLILWAGSHFVGVGEFVDIILLGVGVGTIGFGVFGGVEALYNFATTAINAQTVADLDRAAKYFAEAVNILGITIISSLLLKKSAHSVLDRGRPMIRPMPYVGKQPPAGTPPISRPQSLPDGKFGATDEWGLIAISRNQSLIGQRLTLYHEWVHSILVPRFGPFLKLRAQLNLSRYQRSALLRYLEEAMAETYAQLRVRGLQNVLVGVRFPLEGGYVTISQLVDEGVAIGNIILGGMQFTVYLKKGIEKPKKK